MAEVNVALHMHYSEHADLDGDALLRARGEHDLQVDRSHEGVTAMEGQKVLKFVKLGEYYWVKWHAVAELVMPFVTIEATGIFAAKALSDAVLNRFLAALVEVKVFEEEVEEEVEPAPAGRSRRKVKNKYEKGMLVGGEEYD
eukprot:CAMPEP_0206160786 /NCGR_PEP_ID=MMETSP1474-20131121/7091_1 /ASSEMBLY_ACC=CAM_ASM_001110 /TAXON_ID=97495 /ORGANISM="Imantonia sp., Strain RCC918" /LENGTH=141 /DNA_ID=CAMNT_0053562333 /DNA_START=84 /DNA_END=509 /DNA_ORIENTATION=-